MSEDNSISLIESREKEYNYLLSDFLNEGSCIRCMNGTCKLDSDHGKEYPDILAKHASKPFNNDEIRRSIQSERLNFDKKKPYYTICNYVMGNCNNCRENRVKNIRINGNKIILCHPDFNKIKDKITVGLHIDLKINVQSNKTNISVFPIEPTFFDKTKINNKIINNDRNHDSNYDINYDSNYDINYDSNYDINYDSNYDRNHDSNYEILNNEDSIHEEAKIEEWPSLNNNEITQKKVNINFSKIKDLHQDIDNTEMDNISKINNLESDILILKRLNQELYIENSKLKSRNEILEKNMKDRNKYTNSPICAEIMENITKLNNAVTEQFVKTEYYDYDIF